MWTISPNRSVKLLSDLDLFIYRRVCEIRLEGNHKFSVKQRKYKVSDELKTGEARTLFGKPEPSQSLHAVRLTQSDCRLFRLHCRLCRLILDRHRY